MSEREKPEAPRVESGQLTDGSFYATYHMDEHSSVTGRGASLREAVYRLAEYLGPFGTVLPRFEDLVGGSISECESAVDRVFKQHLSTGRN